MIKVAKERCPQDHPCPLIRICPQKAISQKGFNAPEVDNKKCIKCMLCVQRCGYKAFEKQ